MSTPEKCFYLLNGRGLRTGLDPPETAGAQRASNMRQSMQEAISNHFEGRRTRAALVGWTSPMIIPCPCHEDRTTLLRQTIEA